MSMEEMTERSSDRRVDELHHEFSGFRRMVVGLMATGLFFLAGNIVSSFWITYDLNGRVMVLEAEKNEGPRWTRNDAMKQEERRNQEMLLLRQKIGQLEGQQTANTELLIRINERLAAVIETL